MIAYRVVVQSILILIVWLRLRKRAAALILFLVLFLPGIFAGIWPTFAVTVGIYYLCVRSLIKNKYPDSGKPLLLIILTVLAMSVAVEREYRQNFKINENLGYACLAIAREHFSEELYADAIPYFAEALERCPQWLEGMYLAEYAIALAETGEMVSIDGIGNRVASMLYGHQKVYLVAGRNKLTPDYDGAVWRARNVAAPGNAARLQRKTPCAASGHCHDCRSPERICRGMVVLWENMYFSEMEVVLVDEELGL